ncbi:MAG: GTPase HflX, partial [Gammaproteobacteria bacterium]
ACLRSETVRGWLELAPTRARTRAAFFRAGAVREERPGDGGGYLLQVELPRSEYQRLCQREGLEPSLLG